jgi:CDP-diacylglycerol--serine O-phosphatidyltransferase
MLPDSQTIQRTRGIYLVPNLFTTGGLFAGFYAIVAAMKGSFELAAVAIFIAMIMDTLDGRIARFTKTQTAFGAEYDSLADMVAFGVAPALVVYSWALHALGKVGWLVAFIYTASVALRLARFNTQLKNIDKRYFQGLACPAGAGIVAAMVWCLDVDITNRWIGAAIAILVVAIAILMVSNIRYRSFKEFDISNRVRFVGLLALIVIFVLISIDPPCVLLVLFMSYGLSGPIMTLWRLHKARVERKRMRIAKTK